MKTPRNSILMESLICREYKKKRVSFVIESLFFWLLFPLAQILISFSSTTQIIQVFLFFGLPNIGFNKDFGFCRTCVCSFFSPALATVILFAQIMNNTVEFVFCGHGNIVLAQNFFHYSYDHLSFTTSILLCAAYNLPKWFIVCENGTFSLSKIEIG